MTAAMLLLLSLGASVAADPTEAAFEVTEKRLENFQDSQAELKRISKILASLGDPRKMQKGEDPDKYYERIERIYVHRAQGLVLLQIEYEEALSARYELEADWNYYVSELAGQDKDIAVQQERKREQKKQLEVQSQQLADEVTAIQAAICKAAEKARPALMQKKDRTWIEEQSLAELDYDLKRCAGGARGFAGISNPLELQQRYAKSSLLELREALRTAELRAYNAKYRVERLQLDLDPQQDADAQKLLGARYKIFEGARRALNETEGLERQAVQVSVLAEETREHLRQLRTARSGIARRKKLEQFGAGEAHRLEALQIIAGGPQESPHDSADDPNMKDMFGKGSAEGAPPRRKARAQDRPPSPPLRRNNLDHRSRSGPLLMLLVRTILSVCCLLAASVPAHAQPTASAAAEKAPRDQRLPRDELETLSAQAEKARKIVQVLRRSHGYSTPDLRHAWRYLADYVRAQFAQAGQSAARDRVLAPWRHVGRGQPLAILLVPNAYSLTATRRIGLVSWRSSFTDSYRACLLSLPGQVVLFAYPAAARTRRWKSISATSWSFSSFSNATWRPRSTSVFDGRSRTWGRTAGRSCSCGSTRKARRTARMFPCFASWGTASWSSATIAARISGFPTRRLSANR